MGTEVNSSQDLIDSRDIIKRIEEIESELEDMTDDDRKLQGEDLEVELEVLQALHEEGEQYCADWIHGVTLVRWTHFEAYAREFGLEVVASISDAKWPLTHIDWAEAAAELETDYTELDFAGDVYLAR